MYGAVVERGIIRAADQKKYIVETLDRKGIESLQITALNGAPFAVGDIVYFFLFPDGTGKIICSEAANDTTGFVVDANYVHTDNNYTDDEKAKLSDIEAEAQKNVQSDWNAESGDAFIKNKPTIPEKVSELENDSGFVNSAEAAAAAPVRSVNGHTGDVDIPTVNLPVSVQNGGTGETTAAKAAKNLSVLPLGEVVTKIPSNADLDDYDLPGVYAVRNNSIAETITNIPTPYAGTLRVFSSLGSNITASSTGKYLLQEYVRFNGRTYLREGSSGSGTTVTWKAWRTVVNSDDFPFSITKGGTGAASQTAAALNLGVLDLHEGTVIPNGADWNDYKTPGVYYSPSGTSSATMINTPDNNAGFKLIVGQVTSSTGRIFQIAIYQAGAPIIWKRFYDGSSWSAWVRSFAEGVDVAAARANLAVPNMQTDTYPTLLKPDGGNSWIKIGKANSTYGLLPSQTGGKGSGHNHLGTAYWYWSDAYIDNYYGSWAGDTIPVDKGGTGATTAAAARTNLGAIAMPTVIVKNTTTSSSTADATYTVSGSGVVIVFAGMLSDDTEDYGTFQSRIYYDGSIVMGEGTRWGSALNYMLGASTAVPIAVSNGKKIRIYLQNTKNGTKYVYRRFLCFGCTVS